MGKPFKKTGLGKILGGLGKVIIGGVADSIPGGETLIRLVSKTPEDQENTNWDDFGRILVVIIIGASIFGVIIGKVSPEQLDRIIDFFNFLKE